MDQDGFKFKNVQLLKDQSLGIGSYGAVCKVKCDDLLCAAKILHPTLFDPNAQHQIAPQREHRLPIRRFEQECEFMSAIRHPNIVQYLGMFRDTGTHLPVLLMELMDDSLTHFLESSSQPIPYHIQVNICHDISLALSFLHSNKIVHRDLSSNNVLLIGNIRAKVTDFGMARLGDLNPQATRFTSTMCPGTDVYMPPEAVEDKPVYTEKIDCFSMGVITLQILTKQFPKPGDRNQVLEINHPQVRGGRVKVSIPEVERRQNHISEVDPNHPLLAVVHDCLKDSEVDRPSAQQLCESLAALKENSDYSESVRATCTAEQGIHQELSMNKRVIAQLEGRIAELEKQLGQGGTQHPVSNRQEQSTGIRLKWKRVRNAPCGMSRWNDAAVCNNIMYIRNSETPDIYAYDKTNNAWSQLPTCPSGITKYSITIINGLLTTIGGSNTGGFSDKLFSLIGEGSGLRWSEKFPSMPTKRSRSVTLCTGSTLIVAGGWKGEVLRTVEVMNTDTCQWFVAADLPEPLYIASAAVCGDYIFMLGGINVQGPTKSVYSCSLSSLLLSCLPTSLTEKGLVEDQANVWNRIADLSVSLSTCVSLHGRLLAIGGMRNKQYTTAIYIYDQTANSWEVISHILPGRCRCFAAVLPNNQLMVVGGTTTGNAMADISELAVLI